MLVKSQKLKQDWDVPFKDLQTISREKTGIQLIMKGEDNAKLGIVLYVLTHVQGGVQGPFIPIPTSSSRDYLYKRISRAVHDINANALGFAY